MTGLNRTVSDSFGEAGWTGEVRAADTVVVFDVWVVVPCCFVVLEVGTLIVEASFGCTGTTRTGIGSLLPLLIGKVPEKSLHISIRTVKLRTIICAPCARTICAQYFKRNVSV